MIEYIYALFSTLAWATSAPIVASGLAHIPENKRIFGICLGLLVSLVSGTVTLLIFSIPYIQNIQKIVFSYNLFLAGIFTFPVATGAYYLCGYAFSSKMEVAAQFARVKPLFSVILSIFVLGEKLSFNDGISLAFIVIAIGLIISSIDKKKFRVTGLLFGLLTAFFWSMGEVFIKLGATSEQPIIDTFYSLLLSTILYIVLLGNFIFKKINHTKKMYLACFVYHGVISFGLGYASYYESIKYIGVTKTVIVTAFWPVLAILLVCFWKYLKRQPYDLPKVVWIASIFLCLGSLTQFIR